MRPAILALPTIVLSACQSAAIPEGDWFPLDDGLRWSYAVRDGSRTFRLDTVSLGGDVRWIDETETNFQFVYGRPPDAEHDVTKSIFALPATGPAEFYLDAFTWSLSHDPPLPLLPPAPLVGSAWSWRGRFGHAGTRGTTTDAELRAEVLEDIEVPAGRYTALRVSASYPAFGLKVTRWFTRGIGCVQVVVEGGKAPRSMRLASFSRDVR